VSPARQKPLVLVDECLLASLVLRHHEQLEDHRVRGRDDREQDALDGGRPGEQQEDAEHRELTGDVLADRHRDERDNERHDVPP
jgi:hypothetical protein